jgi:glycolate oxidase FAD binding subunit
MVLAPASLDELCAALRDRTPVLAHGSRSKALLATAPGHTPLDIRALDRLIEYEPGEFTFTAQTGMPLTQVTEMLAANGQHLPCDPPLADAGATLGGMLAAGLNGSGRLRFGGLRDFILGVRFVDGRGRLVRGGGKVVKNAAGFDLPKLLVGSMGRLGIIVELSCKVFPKPAAWQSVRVTCRDLPDALQVQTDLARLPLDLEALDLLPPHTLLARVAGATAALADHARRVAAASGRPCEIIGDADEAACWHAMRAFAWVPADHLLIRIPLTPARIANLEEILAQLPAAPRRYTVAGNLAWLAWPAAQPLPPLAGSGLSGLVVRGPLAAGAPIRLGHLSPAAGTFAARIKNALDPLGIFPPLP